MAIFKKAILVVSLLLTCCCTSGCATMLGGIIGHQSGEMGAGLAIGAAVDFGGDIVNGIGKMMQPDQKKEFQKHAQMDSENGEITLPKSGFNKSESKQLVSELTARLEKEGYSCKMVTMKSSYNIFGQYNVDQSWSCKKNDIHNFDLYMNLRNNQNLKLRVEIPEESRIDKSETTIKLYKLIEEIVIGKPDQAT